MTTYKNFKLNQIFEKIKTKKIKGKAADFPSVENEDYNIPLLTAGAENHGFARFGKREDCPTILKNVISISANGENSGISFYQDQEFAVLQDSYAVKLKNKDFISKEVGIYLTACLNKLLHGNYDWSNKAGWSNIEELEIKLPTNKDNEVDYQFMREEVKRIERSELDVLGDYLNSNKLDNYHLNDIDKKVLSTKPKMKAFKLAKSYYMRGKLISVEENGLFEIMPTKKKINANTVLFNNGQYPYVARGEGKNGIRGYISYNENYLNPSNTISFGQDTATMYYQPDQYFTGDKIQIFSLNKKYGILEEKVALYLISAAKKAFSNFAWGQTSFALDKISGLPIYLPVNSQDKIDFDYMEKYITAIEKLAIKDVVKYKNQELSATK